MYQKHPIPVWKGLLLLHLHNYNSEQAADKSFDLPKKNVIAKVKILYVVFLKLQVKYW